MLLGSCCVSVDWAGSIVPEGGLFGNRRLRLLRGEVWSPELLWVGVPMFSLILAAQERRREGGGAVGALVAFRILRWGG